MSRNEFMAGLIEGRGGETGIILSAYYYASVVASTSVCFSAEAVANEEDQHSCEAAQHMRSWPKKYRFH
jgi:hypothetical protein